MTADLNFVTSAAQTYGDARAADQKAIDDVILAKTKTDDAAALALVQKAYDGYRATHTVADPIAPPVPKTIEFSDFAAIFGGVANSGVSVGAKSLSGAGEIYQMKPNTSTKAAIVAGIAAHSTNPYRLLRVGTGSTTNMAAPGMDVSNITIQGTEQGHMYGGIMLCYLPKSTSHDITVKGVPGNAPGPPGETFPYEIWHCDDHLATNIRVDGRDATGKPVTATGIGLDNSSRVKMVKPVSIYSAYGFGIALWDMADVVIEDGDFRFNRRAMNQENAQGGTFRYTRCNLSGQTVVGPHIVHCSAVTSTPLLVEDPILAAGEWPLKIGVPPVGNWYAAGNGPHKQLISDVKVTIGGVDVTNDKTKVLVGSVW